MSGAITLKGDAKVMRELRRLAEKLPAEASRALYMEGERIMGISKRKYTPVDDGVLRASGFVNQPKHEGQTTVVVLGYGGAASAYAVAVHEHPSGHSPRSWRNRPGIASSSQSKPEAKEKQRRQNVGAVTFHPKDRGPKYLEKPLRAEADKIPGRIADKLRAKLKGG